MASAGEVAPISLIVTLTILVSLFQLLLGLLKLGKVTRFISNAVMTGFFSGIAITIILSQLGGLTGFESEGGSHLTRAIDLLFHLGQIHWPLLLTGLATMAIISFTMIGEVCFFVGAYLMWPEMAREESA